MKTIGVHGQLLAGHRKLFDALGELFNYCIEERPLGNDHGIDAWIINKGDLASCRRITYCELPCYFIVSSEQLVPCGESTIIEFSNHNVLPQVLCGRKIDAAGETVNLMALPQEFSNFAVTASKSSAPVWTVQGTEGHYHHFVALALPELRDNDYLFNYFNGMQFMRLLPLFLFLRMLTDDCRWEEPPLRACFMFDDPNVHWSSYGYINFADIVSHADMYDYHASFAMIPLDTWLVHEPTVSLFKKEEKRISLLIHGNNHTNEELARSESREMQRRILSQALYRIHKFETRSGVTVSRVMAPPHGACNESILRGMADLGFEAVCVSSGSLIHYNQHVNWTGTLGMKASDIIGGLTVLPRFRLSWHCQNSILLAALLRQPIIPVGHHYDVADGLDLLDELSLYIRSLGTVKWMDLKRISRSHYARRTDGQILRVKMLSKLIEVDVPEGISLIQVERSWYEENASETLKMRSMTDGSEWKSLWPEEPTAVQPGDKIKIASSPTDPYHIYTQPAKNLCLWPMARRHLTEARDRLMPFFARSMQLMRKKIYQDR